MADPPQESTEASAGEAAGAEQAGSPTRPERGSVGEVIYERVQALTSQGVSKTDAFNTVASEQNRRAGTVAANYYRVARMRGEGRPRSTSGSAGAGRKGQGPRAARGRRRGSDTPAALAAFESALGDLRRAIEADQARLSELEAFKQSVTQLMR